MLILRTDSQWTDIMPHHEGDDHATYMYLTLKDGPIPRAVWEALLDYQDRKFAFDSNRRGPGVFSEALEVDRAYQTLLREIRPLVTGANVKKWQSWLEGWITRPIQPDGKTV